jgi:hypothetical protein
MLLHPLIKLSLRLSPAKAMLLFFSLLVCQSTMAATYYFSASAGNDGYTIAQARNPSTPWKSLDKLNAYFQYLSPGDSVLLKRGDVFYGSIVASRSGAVFAPIYLGDYGTGNKPEINGLITLHSWKLVKNGVYESACEGMGNSLIIDGTQQAVGRYPNRGYLTYQSHTNNTSITDNLLNDATNWTGAEVVIRKNRWIIDRHTITDQRSGVISYAAGNNAVPTNGYGYFIQNSPKTLDEFGEWYFDAARKTMMVYLGSKNPAKLIIKSNIATNLVDIKRYNYITFNNITFTGAGNNTFNIVQAKKITIKNCSITNTGTIAVLGSYSPFVTVDNCFINNALSGGVNLDAGCTNASVTNNIIKNIGLVAGMGKSGSGTYEGITSFGDNTKIEKNRIDSIGYNGIYFGGNSSYAKNNYITYFCLTKDDGAGIYLGDWSKTANKKVIGNIVMHGVGNYAGAGRSTSLQAEGIYIDDNTESVSIWGNTVSMCANNGIKIHNAKDIDIHNNVVVNNGVQLRLEQDHYLATSSYIRNNVIKNNTFFSVKNVQPAAKFSTHQDDIASFGQLDSNFYLSPAVNNQHAAMMAASVIRNGRGIDQKYNFSNWQSTYGKDALSAELASTDNVLFDYNTSATAKTIVLNKAYTDVHNKVYKNKITIEPYSSVILIAGTQPKFKTGLVNAAVINSEVKPYKNITLLANAAVKHKPNKL